MNPAPFTQDSTITSGSNTTFNGPNYDGLKLNLDKLDISLFLLNAALANPVKINMPLISWKIIRGPRISGGNGVKIIHVLKQG